MTKQQDMVLNAVMDVVLRRRNEHHVPECALRSEIIDRIYDYFPDNLVRMPSSKVVDDELQWLVDHSHLRREEAINEPSYYVISK